MAVLVATSDSDGDIDTELDDVTDTKGVAEIDAEEDGVRETDALALVDDVSDTVGVAELVFEGVAPKERVAVVDALIDGANDIDGVVEAEGVVVVLTLDVGVGEIDEEVEADVEGGLFHGLRMSIFHLQYYLLHCTF